MSDLFGNHIVGFPTRRLIFNMFIYFISGEVGDWKNWFTVAQNELFDRVMTDKMEDISHRFQYD